jgi:hypothetical protein
MADALAMELRLDTASAKGGVEVYVVIDRNLTIPFKLEVISHFDGGIAKDAGLLLKGPGDLMVFLGYSEKTKDLRLALIDRSEMKRKPKDVMNSTAFVDIAIKRFDDGGAVRGTWKQDSRKDAWEEA